MLKVENITKNYYDKKRGTIRALYNVSFELPGKGFYSFIGKSGSGKSTLLNILGGLDRPDEGEITIRGIKSSGLSEAEWNYHRGKTIGIVFQEYNLIRELTVFENIALALEIMKYEKDVVSAKVTEILESLELHDCIYSKVYDLSGGQRQRVAIARAIIKDPDIILADEPTGNLDRESSEIVLKLLKELSKNKLVIMVTHDIDFAKKYSDTVVELSKGEIITDMSIFEISDTLTYTKRDIRKMGLPNKHAFKMTFKNLFQNKFRLFFLTILFTMALVLFYFSISMITFNFGRVTHETFKETEISQFGFRDRRWTNSEFYSNNLRLESELENLRSRFQDVDIFKVINVKIDLLRGIDSDNIMLMRKDSIFYSLTVNKLVIYDELAENQLKLGRISEHGNEILVTDYVALMLLESGLIAGGNIEDVLNQEIVFGIQDRYRNEPSDDFHTFVIVGIIDTDYERFLNLNLEYGSVIRDEFVSKLRNQYTAIYLTQSNLEFIKNSTFNIERWINIYNNGVNLLVAEQIREFDRLIEYDYSTFMFGVAPKETNEIVISVSTMLGIKNMDFVDFSQNKQYYLNSWINKDIILNDGGFLNKAGEEKEYVIVGILDDITNEVPHSMMGVLYVSSEYFSNIYNERMNTVPMSAIVHMTDDSRAMVSLINALDKLSYTHISFYSMHLYDMYEMVEYMRAILFFIAMFVSFFVGLLMYSYFSNSINDKKQQIGILRSMGLTGRDCMKIFTAEGMTIVAIVNILTLVSTIIIIGFIQNVIKTDFQSNIILFQLTVFGVWSVLMFSIIVTIASSYISLRKIVKLNPIESIK